MYSHPIFKRYATIDPSERKKWRSYLPIARTFGREKSTTRNPGPLKQLAARVIGQSLAPGVEESAWKLPDLVCIAELISTVFQYLTLNREEYQRFLHYEWYYPTSSPLQEGYWLFRTHYNKLYPTAAEHYVDTVQYSQEGQQIMQYRKVNTDDCTIM
jgi:hypothetical protein